MRDLSNGENQPKKALSPTQSLKNEFRALVPDLPKDWRDRARKADNFYASATGNTRLDNLRGGYAAPTLEELKLFKEIAGK